MFDCIAVHRRPILVVLTKICHLFTVCLKILLFELTIRIMLQMDWNETMIHDPVLGVNIFMPIVTGTKLGLVVRCTRKQARLIVLNFRKR